MPEEKVLEKSQAKSEKAMCVKTIFYAELSPLNFLSLQHKFMHL